MGKKGIGILVILLGIVLAIQTYLKVKFEFWPLLIIAAGIIFLLVKANKGKKNYFLATFLILLGIYFYFNVLTSWKYSSKLWPTYVLIVSISFYVNYFAGKVKASLYVANFMVLLSIAFYVLVFTKVQLWPVILILIGLWLLFSPKDIKKYFYIINNREVDEREVDESNK